MRECASLKEDEKGVDLRYAGIRNGQSQMNSR